jgi:lysyl-tRNA synthetase class 2
MITQPEVQLSENEQIAIRKQKLTDLRKQGTAYPNNFYRQHLADDLTKQYGQKTKEELAAELISVKIAGRIMTRRIMGKASFVHLQDMSGKIQNF